MKYIMIYIGDGEPTLYDFLESTNYRSDADAFDAIERISRVPGFRKRMTVWQLETNLVRCLKDE